MNKLIYIIKIRTELSNGVGDPIAIPYQETFEVEDALALVSVSQTSLLKHQEEVSLLLELMKDRYVLSSDIKIQLVGFGTMKQEELPSVKENNVDAQGVLPVKK